MSGSMQHDDAADRRAPVGLRRGAGPSGPEAIDTGGSVSHAADPRLGHGGGAASGLLALQRSAGNAAVSSMIAGEPSVQRAVVINELDVTPAAPADAAAPAQTGGAGGAGGAVTSDGGNTTITGGTVTIDGGTVQINAAMTQASGVLQADTLIANSVVASSYTPGAGNVW